MEKTDTLLSRRRLLVLAGATAAFGGAFAASKRMLIAQRARTLFRAQPGVERRLSLANAAYDDWIEQVGSVFGIGGGYDIQLIGVRVLNSVGARPANVSRQRAFIAVFTVLGGGTMAGDLIYTVSNPQYSPFQMFLSAASDPATPGRMLAVYN